MLCIKKGALPILEMLNNFRGSCVHNQNGTRHPTPSSKREHNDHTTYLIDHFRALFCYFRSDALGELLHIFLNESDKFIIE